MYSTSMKKLLSLLTVFALVFGMIAMVRPMQANAATAVKRFPMPYTRLMRQEAACIFMSS